MSKCELRVELEAAGPVVAGTEVAGVLHAHVSEPVRCNGLTVQLRWFTHGAGNRASATVDPIRLFAGQWQVGRHAYPFRLSVPNRPLTTRGELVNLDWEVMARADVPWAFDPKASADFVVERGPPAPAAPLPAGAARMLKAGAALSVVLPLVFGLMMTGVGGVFAAVGVSVVLSGQVLGALFALVGLAVLGGGVAVLLRGLRKAALARRFETRMLSLVASSLLPGGETEATVTLAARKPVDVEAVEVVLLRRESATSGSGTDQSTEHHDEEAQRETVADRLYLKAGDAFEERVTLRVPAEAAPSLTVSSNQVAWVAVLEVTVQGQGTLTREVPLQVL